MFCLMASTACGRCEICSALNRCAACGSENGPWIVTDLASISVLTKWPAPSLKVSTLIWTAVLSLMAASPSESVNEVQARPEVRRYRGTRAHGEKYARPDTIQPRPGGHLASGADNHTFWGKFMFTRSPAADTKV